jgi:YHS domain-containing protein
MRDDLTAGRQTKGEPLVPRRGRCSTQLFSGAPDVATAGAWAEYIDPVRGMVVDPEETPFVITREPESVYFCSRQGQDEHLSRESMSVRGVL